MPGHQVESPDARKVLHDGQGDHEDHQDGNRGVDLPVGDCYDHARPPDKTAPWMLLYP